MAVHITFRNASHVGGSSILSRAPRAAETITNSGTSQTTTITALQGEICHIKADAAVHIAVDTTAVSGEGDLVLAGSWIEIGPMNAGDTISVINQ